ncbi:MAG: GAF domain-containing protein, partial [Anaerolineales bacterium]
MDIDSGKTFSDTDIRLVETVANAMSVALENARLFDEVQRKNTEITESLERETASNDILRVIAESPTDIQPVLDVIARNAAQLSGSDDAIIGLVEGDTLIVSTHFGNVPMIPVGEGIRFNRDSVAGRAMIDGIPLQAIHNQRGVKSEYPEGDRVAKKYGYRMSAGIPLMRKGKAVGVITIRRVKPNLLTDSQMALVQPFANQAAIAVENVRLFEAEQQRVAELAIINSVQNALASKLDFQSLIDAVGDKLMEIFPGENVTIAFLDRAKNMLKCPYMFENGKRIENVEFPLGVGLTSHLVKDRQPLLINTNFDQRAEQLGGISVSDEPNPKCWLGVPIVINDEYVGDFTLQNWDQENAYTESHVRLLQTLAGSLGVALEKARLFEAEQERVAELQIINSIQQGLAAELNFQAIVDLVGDKLREVFDTGDFGIRWYDDKTNLVHFLYEYEHGERLDVPPQPPNPGGTFDLFLKDRKPIVANTAELSARTGGTVIEGTDMSKSIISVPIISSDRLTGSLQIEDYERENAYGESELRLLTTIAASLGTALENARLFDETQRLLKETE